MIVYLLLNTITNKCYVGQHKGTKISGRWRKNLSGGHNKHLDSSVNKYGWYIFTKEVLNYCSSQEEMDTLEQLWILTLRSYDPMYGYNKTYGGHVGRRTPEANLKISRRLQGHSVSIETRQKLRIANEGTKHPESGPKISAANKNRVFTKEHHLNLAVARNLLGNDSEYIKKMAFIFQDPLLKEKRSKIAKQMWLDNPTISITDGISNKRISKDSVIPSNWRKGITRKHRVAEVWITNEEVELHIDAVHTVPAGWRIGRKKHSTQRIETNRTSHLGIIPWNKGKSLKGCS